MDAFEQGMEVARLSAASTASVLGTERTVSAVGRRNKGPNKSVVKCKFYLLPGRGASNIPTFNPKRAIDPKILQHMQEGYGMLNLLSVLT